MSYQPTHLIDRDILLPSPDERGLVHKTAGVRDLATHALHAAPIRGRGAGLHRARALCARLLGVFVHEAVEEVCQRVQREVRRRRQRLRREQLARVQRDRRMIVL
jgi:hypothetical protein